MKKVLLVLLCLFVSLNFGCALQPKSGDVETGVIFEQNNIEYIYLGEYPRSLASKEALSSMSESADDGYYTSRFDGGKYVKLECKPYESGYAFADKTVVMSGEERYFKLEPIKWRVLSKSGGVYTVIANELIDCRAFFSEQTDIQNYRQFFYGSEGVPDGTALNNYYYSEIRQWLNGEFYENCFSDHERTLIVRTTYRNDAQSAYPSPFGNNRFCCKDTNDYISLPSYADATAESYGFRSYYGDTDPLRLCRPTDYALAKGVRVSTQVNKAVLDEYGEAVVGTGSWWLRTPCYFETYEVNIVSSLGVVTLGYYVGSDQLGVRPIMAVAA